MSALLDRCDGGAAAAAGAAPEIDVHSTKVAMILANTFYRDAAAADADDERGAPPERLADFGQQCSVLLSLMS